jgi:hypothetical protein
MARALMVEPTMVMLDEPMAGVNPALTQSLLGHVKDLRAQGMTVLFVEHDMDMVRDISDWVVVMAQGKIVAEGPPDVVMADQAVIDAYLGAHHDAPLSGGGAGPARGRRGRAAGGPGSSARGSHEHAVEQGQGRGREQPGAGLRPGAVDPPGRR